MKKIYILKTVGLFVFLSMSILSNGQSDLSVALKTIRTVDDMPVVYQTEIKGGYHHYDVMPWTTIPLERLSLGMIAHNTTLGTSYRYIGTAFVDDVATFNREEDWERILVVTFHDENKNYAAGEIVISDSALYTAKSDIDASGGPVLITDSRWSPIGSDNQEITDFSIEGDTLSITLEDGGTDTVVLSQFYSEFRVNDQVTPLPVATYKSGGTEIILISADYTLPAASTMKGATVTVKNTKAADASNTARVLVSPTPSEDIDGSSLGIDLFRQYDYITLVSDGTQWFKVAEGSTKVAQRNILVDEEEHLDAFYLGNPNDIGSWRIIYNDASDRLLIQRLKADGTWKTKTSIVP